MNTLLIRRYKDSDIPEISKIYYKTVHEVNSKDYTQEQIKAWAPEVYPDRFWEERFKHFDVYVAEQDGEVLGFVELEETGHIDCFYVRHDWQRRGVGTKLLDRVEKRAEELDISRLYADVSVTAKPFFENRGFEMVEEEKVTHRDVQFKLYFMEKIL